MKKKFKPQERDPEYEYALYSEDDGVQMYENETDALVTKRAWIKASANGVKGPFKMMRSKLDRSAPALIKVGKALLQWAETMGGWEAKPWRELEAIIKKAEATK